MYVSLVVMVMIVMMVMMGMVMTMVIMAMIIIMMMIMMVMMMIMVMMIIVMMMVSDDNSDDDDDDTCPPRDQGSALRAQQGVRGAQTPSWTCWGLHVPQGYANGGLDAREAQMYPPCRALPCPAVPCPPPTPCTNTTTLGKVMSEGDEVV